MQGVGRKTDGGADGLAEADQQKDNQKRGKVNKRHCKEEKINKATIEDKKGLEKGGMTGGGDRTIIGKRIDQHWKLVLQVDIMVSRQSVG